MWAFETSRQVYLPQKVRWPARICIQQLCADTGYSLGDLLRAIDDSEGWRERIREIHAGSATWWWWWWCYIMGWVFDNGVGYRSSIPGRVIPKTQKMILDTSMLKTMHYKIRIKGKVKQSRQRSSALNIHLSEEAIEKRVFESPSTTVANFTHFLYTYIHTYIYLVNAY